VKNALKRYCEVNKIKMNKMKVDVVIPTRDRRDIEGGLLKAITEEPKFNNLIITDVKPLSKARLEGCKKASTEWVAMFDDDMLIPSNWLQSVLNAVDSNTGAVATVSRQHDASYDAYYNVVSSFYPVYNLDSDPRIGNVLIKRNLMLNFQPTSVFTGEDQYLRSYIEKSGYLWKVLPYIGVIHVRRTTINVDTGMYYKRYRYYNNFQLLRRLSARFLLGSLTPLVSHRLFMPFDLWKDDVKFLSGWLKETFKSQ
jgi:glycosyltransferase involved in cell wall biosynthesis